MNHARRTPVSARTAAEGAVTVIACSAGLAWMGAHALVRAGKAAGRKAWAWAHRRLRAAAVAFLTRDARLTPALARHDTREPVGQTIYDSGPFDRVPEPDTPPPFWVTTDTPSPAELALDGESLPRRP